LRPGQGIADRPGAGGGGTQLRPDRPNVLPSRPGQGGSGTQLRPDRPNILPSRPGQGGGGEQLRPGGPQGILSRPGQGGSGTQWRPDRPNVLPSRPGQGGSGTQWRPDRPNLRPDRPIINNGTANIGNRFVNNNFNNVNVNQWNQYNRNVVAGGGYNHPWYGSAGYWNQPFYGGLSAGYWSRPWNNLHYGWLSGYSSGLFSAIPSFWAGSAVASADDIAPTFAYSNPYYDAPPQGDTNIVIQGLDYAQPIPAPTVEQTVIAYPPAPDQADIQAGEPLPTTPPPAPPEDDTATAANKLFDAARAAFKDGQYADAQAKTEQAIAKLPSDAALHEFRCLCLFAQGKYKDAAAGLYAVLAAGPGWDWQTVRGLYGNADDYTKQLRALEGYVKDHLDAADGHFLLAYHYLVLGSKNDAVNQFKEVIRVQPNDKLSPELVKALTTTPKEVAAAGTGQ
jgi:TolA-binding protein